jgi:hypothetical protein
VAEELEPLWLTAVLRVPEAFGCYISLHSGLGGGHEEEDLFVFNDTMEGPRAPAVKPGCVTHA